MTQYAILCGSAPEGYSQKKLNDMCDFLASEEGGSWAQSGIMTFPNGVSEKMLEFVLAQLIGNNETETSTVIARSAATKQSINEDSLHVLLYICTETPVADHEQSVWLGGEEIHKSVFSVMSAVAAESVEADDKASSRSDKFNARKNLDIQVIYESDREFVADEVFESEEIINN